MSEVTAAPASRPLEQAAANRWVIPVGAVLVHVCIGSVYAWSTFNRPIQALLPDAPWWFSPPYTTFTTALALLGLSAAFGGPWVERRGPRVAATAAARFFGTGLLIGGVGLALRQSVLVFLGMGVVSGIGCGLGYISPVSTLVKWFPDRRGMATGMAIMGFGGGAFIAGYLNVFLMDRVGVATTVMALGVVYLAVMLRGLAPDAVAAGRAGGRRGGTGPARTSAMIADGSVTRDQAVRTPQFYLLVGHAVHQRHGGHRHPGPGVADDAGHVRPYAARGGGRGVAHQPVQRRRPVPVGVGLRLHRAPEHVSHLLPGPGRAVPPDSAAWRPAAAGGCSRSACSWCSRCTAADSPRFRRFWPTSSGPRTSGRFTGRCSRRGAWLRSPARSSSPSCRTAPRPPCRPAPTASTSTTCPSRCWPACWPSASS